MRNHAFVFESNQNIYRFTVRTNINKLTRQETQCIYLATSIEEAEPFERHPAALLAQQGLYTDPQAWIWHLVLILLCKAQVAKVNLQRNLRSDQSILHSIKPQKTWQEGAAIVSHAVREVTVH